jgi:hypothetical protein
MPNYVDQAYKEGNIYDVVTGKQINSCVLIAVNNGVNQVLPLYTVLTRVPTSSSSSAYGMFYYNFGSTLAFTSNGSAWQGLLPPVSFPLVTGNRFFLYGSNNYANTATGGLAFAYETTSLLKIDGYTLSGTSYTFSSGRADGAMLVAHPTEYRSIFPYYRQYGKGCFIKTGDYGSRFSGQEMLSPSASTTVTLTVNVPLIVPVFVTKNQGKFVRFEVTTAVASSNVRMTPYAVEHQRWSSPSTVVNGSYPLYRIGSGSGTSSTTATGVKTVSIVDINDATGWIFILLVQQGGASGVALRGITAKTYNGVVPRIGTISSTTNYQGFTCNTIAGTPPTSLVNVIPIASVPAITVGL